MPELTMFTVCESVGNVSPQPGVNIPQLMGPQTVLRPMFIPGSFSFGVSAGVIGINLKQSNSVKFTIKTPTGQIVQASENAVFPPIFEDDSLPQEYQGFMLTLDVRNMVVEEQGNYSFELFINDESVGSRAIPIFVASRK